VVARWVHGYKNKSDNLFKIVGMIFEKIWVGFAHPIQLNYIKLFKLVVKAKAFIFFYLDKLEITQWLTLFESLLQGNLLPKEALLARI
jgi:hypothetical protein